MTMTSNSFDTLNLIPQIRKAVAEEGYETPTPIQTRAIPVVLDGKDLFGIAQTGTGKTAAFAIPILQRLSIEGGHERGRRVIKSLICTPTRELAIQIGESFSAYGRHTGIRHTVIYGGVGQLPQTEALKRGVDILVATPGRLLDLIGQGYIKLDNLSIFVLDEADRMLDMGFIHDIRKIMDKLPKKRQTLLFSATMPPDIVSLASAYLINPSRVEVTPQATPVEVIEQSVYFVEKNDKRHLLAHILKDEAVVSALVFTRTKHGADRVVKDLQRAGINAQAIHGNKSQNARQRALGDFKSGHTRVLIATDIAARGIDIDELSHVINFDLPEVPETYVHRIGRTGRAGLSGIALSFCDSDERDYLRDIQKLIGRALPVVEEHPYKSTNPAPVFEARRDDRKPERRPERKPEHKPRNEHHQKPQHEPKKEPKREQPRHEPKKEQPRPEPKPEPKPGSNPAPEPERRRDDRRPRPHGPRPKDDRPFGKQQKKDGLPRVG
ncbi:MAG TPA: DEAD/DEAH box helicase [bacterium]|nr:DEAD/DEAH box helicase [bacterium]